MSNDLEKRLIEKASIQRIPVKATFELTPLCNMNCRMCYIRHSASEVQAQGGTLPLSYWKSLIPQMKDMGVLFVSLIGGEPFLYEGIRELYQELKANGFYINLTTNATLLADHLPSWFLQNPPRYVTVSLYGASDETYQKLTGHPHGFTDAVRGLENLIAAGIPTKLNYVMVPENRKDFKKIIQIRDHYDLPLLTSSYCFRNTRKTSSGNTGSYRRLTASEAAEAELLIQKHRTDRDFHAYRQYLAGGKYLQNTEKHTRSFWCHAGNSTFWLTWDGWMQPCGLIHTISVNNRTGSLSNNWEKLKEKTAEAQTASRCAACEKREICQVCPAIMESETGRIDGCPEYLCEMTDTLIQLALRQEKRPEK